MRVCKNEVNPGSILSNFRGSLHFDTSFFYNNVLGSLDGNLHHLVATFYNIDFALRQFCLHRASC